MAGVELDPWQAFILSNSLNEDAAGKWSAFEVGVEVPRQNGKGGYGEGRVLAGLFLLGEKLIIWSAHQFDTSLEAFRRLLMLIEDTPEFDQRVQRVSRAHGEEGIELKGGQRVRFRTRTKGGGRGFSSDCLILDEAMILPESAHGALLPTLSAKPNPQVIYMGSAVDQWIHEHGVVFARIRERGLTGNDPALAYFEWSAAFENPQQVGDAALDPEVWAQANPALGIRISAEHIERERLSMDPRTFAVERLGVGDWPRTDGFDLQVIPPEMWRSLRDPDSEAKASVRFGFDVSPDRSSASIAAAGLRHDGRWHAEVVERADGAGWVVPRLAELVERHGQLPPRCDGAGPAGSLVPQLEQLGIEVETLSAREYAEACGSFFDTCAEDALRHLGQDGLDSAIKGAARRNLGDAWAWSRKSSATDITSLVACTVALQGAMHGDGISVYEDRDLLILD